MKVVCISDTHGRHQEVVVPDGDMVIHAGDFSRMSNENEIRSFRHWFRELPHKHKILIAGNHDKMDVSYRGARHCLYTGDANVARHRQFFERDGITYLHDSSCWVQDPDPDRADKRWKIWGSPWQPYFFDWSFQRQPGAEMKRIWDRIPMDTDVLVTHGPPLGVLDECDNLGAVGDARRTGCAELGKKVERMTEEGQGRLRLHVFGHIHEGYGRTTKNEGNGITEFVNACSCDMNYEAVNPPIVVEL